MTHQSRRLLVALAFLLAVCVLIAVPSSRAAPTTWRFGLVQSDRAATDLTFPYMHETTSLRPNGDGEERVEFVLGNNGFSPIRYQDFLFRVGNTAYWGIQAFDAQGAIDHQLNVVGDEVYVRVHFRQPLAPGGQYRYTFVINFPELAQASGETWALSWGTYFPVAEFVRTVYLPGGGDLLAAAPTPDEQTADYVRWRRFNMTAFELTLSYELRALSDQDLAEEYAPSLRIHSADAYWPMPVNLALQHAECDPGLFGSRVDCSLGLLGGDWLDKGGSYVDFHGHPGRVLTAADSSEAYYRANIRGLPGNAPVAYARVWRGGGHTVIQYWLYYYYNSWGHQGGLNVGGIGLHEGDWEMVQVVLDGSMTPRYAAFAQHLALPLPYLNFDGASKKEWNDLARDTVDGDHPIVYVGLGSHASYFGPYPYLYALDHTASESAPLLRPAVHLLEESGADAWVGYAGAWGQPRPGLPPYFNGGPASPGQQTAKWSNPLDWAQNSVEWDEVAGHNRGKVRAWANAPCKVGIVLMDTGQWFGWIFNEFYRGIPGGEYVVNEARARSTAILHYTYKIDVSDYLVVFSCPEGFTPSARQTGEAALAVEFYDPARDALVTAHYALPAGWTPETTSAAVGLDDPTLALSVDYDDNGTTDEVVSPDEIIEEPFEPPQPGGMQLYVPLVSR